MLRLIMVVGAIGLALGQIDQEKEDINGTIIQRMSVVANFEWTTTDPDSNRRIELEFYDPANNNHCNRLEPTNLYEYGGDWIASHTIDNECGGWGSEDERVTFSIKDNNVSTESTYKARATADIVYSASYGGETNVSYTCWACSDDWLGKMIYDANEQGTSSTP